MKPVERIGTSSAASPDLTSTAAIASLSGDGLEAVADLADWVTSAGCTALVVSLGVDASSEDPESPLQVTSHGFRAAGRRLGSLGLPSVLVQEGGYHLETMGGLVAAYLAGHADEAGRAGPTR